MGKRSKVRKGDQSGKHKAEQRAAKRELKKQRQSEKAASQCVHARSFALATIRTVVAASFVAEHHASDMMFAHTIRTAHT